MTRVHLAASTRALVSGAICLAILAGMIAGHAWPLWTGRTIVMGATVHYTGRSAPGEYAGISTPADVLRTGPAAPGSTVNATEVRVAGPWWEPIAGRREGLDRRLRGTTVYIQLEPSAGGEYVPVSVSRAPVDGALNLRGIIAQPSGPQLIHVEYGLDAFYMHEGQAEKVEKASRDKRRVQIEVAIASSGRARIRRLLVDDVPAG
jgi:GDYXXLXY motif protein